MTSTIAPDGSIAAHGIRVSRMAADPEITGNLLAVGVAMSAIIDAGVDERLTLKRIHNLAFGTERGPYPQIRRVLESDVRRYVPPELTGKCGAPTPRKPSCGRNSNRAGYLVDWATGEKIPSAACSQHAEWFEKLHQENRDAKPEVGGPLPYANAGGRLARHFPEVDWPALWRKLNKRWEPMPEREPVEPCAPTLTVLNEEPVTANQAAKPRSGKPDRRHRGCGGLYAVPNPED